MANIPWRKNTPRDVHESSEKTAKPVTAGAFIKRDMRRPGSDLPGDKAAALAQRKKDRTRSALLTVLVLVILLAVASVVYFVLNKQQSHEFSVDLYQYHGGRRVDIAAPSEVTKGSVETVLSNGTENISLDSRPLYVAGEDTLYLPQPTMVVFPSRAGIMYRLDPFAKIDIKNSTVTAKTDTGLNTLDDAFIFDGTDLYVFLTDVVVECEGEQIALGPLSYIRVEYGRSAEVYDYATDAYRSFPTLTSATIVRCDSTSTPFEINAGTDTLSYGSTQQLLLSDPTLLPTMK